MNGGNDPAARRRRGAIAALIGGLLLAGCAAGNASIRPPSPVTVPASGIASSGPSASASVPTSALAASPPAFTSPPAVAASLVPGRPAHGSPPVAAPSPAAGIAVDESANGRTITLHVGARLTVVLHNTYWEFAPASDPAVLAADGMPVVTPAGPVACVPGAGCGTVTAAFSARSTGRAVVRASRTTCGEAVRCVGGRGDFEVAVVVVA